MKRSTPWMLLVAANVLVYCVLSFYQTGAAAPQPPQLANSAEQRIEMIDLLRDVKDLLKEQNALLRSGEVKVIVTELPKLAAPANESGEAPQEAGQSPANQ